MLHLAPPLYPPKPLRGWAGTSLHKRILADDQWIIEPKIDGDRCLVFSLDGGPQLWSRHGRRFTHSYLGGILTQLTTMKLSVGTVLDAELVAGVQHQQLHLFDVASSDANLKDRRDMLLRLCKRLPAQIAVVPWLSKVTAYNDALKAGHEGIVCKRVDSHYEWQRGTTCNEVPTWVKMKP